MNKYIAVWASGPSHTNGANVTVEDTVAATEYSDFACVVPEQSAEGTRRRLEEIWCKDQEAYTDADEIFMEVLRKRKIT